ncbi:dTDP-4-dehydrorhamnose reductase [Candidatus Nitrospira bockiana]
MTRYLLIGSRGQLGSDLSKAFHGRGELVTWDHNEMDICETAKVRQGLEAVKPSVVINTAAFHKTDVCEQEYRRAFEVNGYAVGELARVCQAIGAKIVHFSTDYVFSGNSKRPLLETDATDPINAYGCSKRVGESLIEAWTSRYLIFRVSGLYGIAGSSGKGGNFVELMLKLARERKPIRVVDDQILTPTATSEVAATVWKLIDIDADGTYHCTNNGQCSWYEFAQEIFRLAKVDANLSPQTTQESGAKAKRPCFSVLQNKHLQEIGLDAMSDWRDALAQYMWRREFMQ